MVVSTNELRLGRPVFENIDQDPKYSFYWHQHDFPSPLAKWNYHPEYELHLITRSRGTYFVGDYAGRFGPGNLVLVGPNLPHTWFSDPHEAAPVIVNRDVVLQFKSDWLDRLIGLCPELACLHRLTADAARGVHFYGRAARACADRLVGMRDQDESTRLLSVLALLRRLLDARHRHLASAGYALDTGRAATEQVDCVLRYISRHLDHELPLGQVAAAHAMTPSAFSRFFKRATGDTFVAFVRRMRIEQACRQLLDTDAFVGEICFAVGYNNLSNFNRCFRALKGTTPSAYRRWARAQCRE